MIERVPSGHGRFPAPTPSNQERHDRWLPLYNLFRARERTDNPTPRKQL